MAAFTIDLGKIETFLAQHLDVNSIEGVVQQAEGIEPLLEGFYPQLAVARPVLGFVDEALTHISHMQSTGKDHETAAQAIGALMVSLGAKFMGKATAAMAPTPMPAPTPTLPTP